MEDGLLVVEVDLNLCRQIKDKWCFRVGQVLIHGRKSVDLGLDKWCFRVRQVVL